jgi:hypothetical protein
MEFSDTLFLEGFRAVAGCIGEALGKGVKKINKLFNI